MNPILFALRHPITTMMLVVALVGGGILGLSGMRVDIFPPINVPQIYVFTNYGGMSPSQMEGLIVNQFELAFQYVDGVKSIESRCIQQVARIKLTFYAGTDVATATGQVVSEAMRALSRMPPGTLPPLVMAMTPGSVPVGYLVMSSKTRSLGSLGDLAQNNLRALVQGNVAGTVAVSPFGPNMRSILVNVDPDRLRSYNLSMSDLVDALDSGNVVIPAGNLYIRGQMPLVPSNSLVADPQDLGKIPLRMGENVFLRDVATIEDGTDVNYGYALVNGRLSVFLPIVKKDTASTLTVVDQIRGSMPLFRDALPEDVEVSFEFDESPTVKTAIRSVATEGFIGASLTGLMILLFLRDPRSVLVVVLNIPLALMGSLFGLYVSGNTINIMTLGGMALAIGMLVDEATVSIENIHVQMGRTTNLARAVERGSNETAVPRLLAMLCILSVFIPAFIMEEPIRSLFLPLALAVGFAMIASYFLSSTLVPVLCVWILKLRRHEESGGSFARVERRFERFVSLLVHWRWVTVPVYLGACALVLLLVGSRLGTELFPQVDSGEFVLRFRPPAGSSYEITRKMGLKCLEVIQEEAKPDNVMISMGYVGQVAPNYSMNNLVLFMRGPDDGQLRLKLREDSGIRLDEFRERLRKVLGEKIPPFVASVLRKEGQTEENARALAATCIIGFEPGDLVSEVMSFGSPTPIEVQVAGPSLPDARKQAMRILREFRSIPAFRDVQIQQTLEYPVVNIKIDREKAGLSGVTTRQVGDSVLTATSSSRFISLNYWQDPKTGFDYQVQIQVPIRRMTSAAQVATLPVAQVDPDVNLMVRDVSEIADGVLPGQFDRSAMQRYLSVTANLEGTDLGRASRSVMQALGRAGKPPRGIRQTILGQVAPMNEMFRSLGIGLALAVVVILVLLTAYFQSPRLALVSVSAVPGVLTGVVVLLYITGTTLNIESFMGVIMAIGVSVSNSVMLVTFARGNWVGGAPADVAAIEGAASRLRPILMTACAMVVGMIPMALALEAGSQMQAPLARAVIGGLFMSTLATLLILPPTFAIVLGSSRPREISLDPNDPDSPHHDGGEETPPAPPEPAEAVVDLAVPSQGETP